MISLCGSNLIASTISIVYEGGDISSTLYNLPTTTSRALEPGVFSIYVPHMEMISSIDLQYSMTAVGSCTMAEQQSFLSCVNNNQTEPQVYSGSGNSSGTYQYDRTGLDLANGLFGQVMFELHAFRSSGGTGSNADYNYVEGSSWTITIHTEPMEMNPDTMELYYYGEDSYSITLAWSDSHDPTDLSWDLSWGEAGFDILSEANLVPSITESGYFLSGLQASTSYEFYVRRVLPEGGSSDWFGPCAFRTLMENGYYQVSFSGEMPTTFDPAPTTSSRATEYSTILVDIPDGKVIDRIDLSYSMIARSGSSIADQRSFLVCTTNGATEAEVYSGVAAIPEGRCSYNRGGLSLASGLTGLVSFELHAFRTSGGSGSNADYNFVEDGSFAITVYYVEINAPTGLHLADVNTVSAVINWEENCVPPVNNWDILYGPQGFDPTTEGTLVNIDSCPFTLSGLSEMSEYHCYVRSNPGAAGMSAWVGPLVISTLAANEIVFFHNGDDIPTNYNPGSSPAIRADQPGLLRATIPENKEISSLRLRYSMSTNNGALMSEQKSFLLCSTNGISEDQLWYGSGGEGVYNYSRDGLQIANELTGEVDFELHAFRTAGGSGSNLDYQYVVKRTWQLIIALTDRPELKTPMGLAVENIGPHSAELSWTDRCYPEATMWDIIYGHLGFDPEIEGTLISNINTYPYLLSDLLEYTEYGWYVRANKADIGQSEWTGPHTFSTHPEDAIILVYDLGDIPSTYNTVVTLPSRAYDPGILSATIPENKRIVSLDLSYSISTDNGSWMSEQRSFLVCATNGTTEAQVYSGSGDGLGVFDYNRTKLSIANGLHGVVDFELHVFRTWGGSGSDTDYQYVVNGSWQLIIALEDRPFLESPRNLTEDDIQFHSVELNWTDDCYPETTMWEIIYGHTGFDPETQGTLISNIATHPYQLTGVQDYTDYDWYVRINMADLGVSAWGGPGSFSTPAEETVSLVYNLGDILNPYQANITTNSRCPSPGVLSVTIPEEKQIVGLELGYTIYSSAPMSYDGQSSFLLCATNGVTESQVYGAPYAAGWVNYHRSKLSIANGLHGVVDFELHAFRNRGIFSDWDVYQYVPNNTWNLTIILRDRLTLEIPDNLSADNIECDSAELNWTDSSYPDATMWDIIYGPAGFDPETQGTLITNINTRPYLLNGLIDEMEYSWYVRANKADLGVSAWAGPHTFVTSNIIETFTYTGGNIPTTYKSGEVALADRAASPGLMSVTVPEGKMIDKIDLEYTMVSYSPVYMRYQRSFLLCSTNSVTETQVYAGTGNEGSYHYDRRGLDIAYGLSGTVDFELHPFHLIWWSYTDRAWVENGSWQLAVNFTEHSPTGLTAANISYDSADLNWSENCVPASTAWDLIYGHLGFDLESEGTLIENLSSNSCTLDGLVEGSAYSWYVRSRLNTGKLSHWSAPNTFLTLPDDGELITYNLGNIPTTYNPDVSTSSRALEPGLLSVSVPEGKEIVGIDLLYEMSTGGGSWISEQRSFLLCSNDGITEPEVYSGVGNHHGIHTYFREGLTLANGLCGEVNFELHAFRSWGGSESTTYYGYVADGTWRIILHYADVSVTLVTPLTAVSVHDGSPLISWNAVDNAQSYKVYCSDNPSSSASWTLLGIVPASELSYSYSGTETRKFFRVVACSVLPAKSELKERSGGLRRRN
ncbi:MAG: hypothetical protein PHC57_04210 [Candidatus Cloacimonetes bacterium]|nr:hypothetical protein [Candidatus Cloacimonadota bacterium]